MSAANHPHKGSLNRHPTQTRDTLRAAATRISGLAQRRFSPALPVWVGVAVLVLAGAFLWAGTGEPETLRVKSFRVAQAAPGQVPAASDFVQGDFWALIIGIDEYPNLPAGKQLLAAKLNAEAVARVLRDRFGFAKEQIYGLYDGQATRGAIFKQLRALIKDVGANDSLIIYFAGQCQVDAASKDVWWLPADAQEDDPNSFISVNGLQSLFAQIPARHLYLVTDSCVSAGLLGVNKIIGTPTVREAYQKKSRWVLSSGVTFPVPEVDPRRAGLSVFTQAFVKALQGNQDAYTTPLHIALVLAKQMPGPAVQTLKNGPMAGTGDDGGQFVFRVDGAPITAAALALRIPSQEDPRLATLRQQIESTRTLTNLPQNIRDQAIAALQAQLDAVEKEIQKEAEARRAAEEERAKAAAAALAKPAEAERQTVAAVARQQASEQGVQAAARQQEEARLEALKKQAEEAARQAELKRQQEEQRLAALKKQTEEAEKAAKEAELKRQQEEQARQAELKRQQEEAAKRRAEEEAALAALKKQAEEAARQAELKRQQEEQRLAALNKQAEEEARQAELKRQEEVKQRAATQQKEAAQKDEGQKQAEEAARQAELKRQQEEQARQAELKRQQEEAAKALAEQEARLAALKKQADEAEKAAREAEQKRQQEEQARQAELKRQQEEAAKALAEQEARLAALKKQTEEEARQAEVKRKEEEQRLAALRSQEQATLTARVPTTTPKPPTIQPPRPEDLTPMVLIPAGEFPMGSNPRDGQADEVPQHKVFLDAYHIDKYDTTVARYAKYLEATGADPPEYWNLVNPATDGNLPVIGMDWDQAHGYCQWAGKRLPTEAEWEKAARGTDGRKHPWGNDSPTPQYANYGKGGSFGYSKSLTPVGSYEIGKSPYGIYDMIGNVWQWVADWYDKDYYQGSPEKNPKGPEKGQFKVIRGGSWAKVPLVVRVAGRNRAAPSSQTTSIGFRCARDAR